MRTWEHTLSDLLHIFRLDSIKRKIIAFSLLATLIPSFTMGWLSYRHSKEMIEKKTVEELVNVTASASKELGLWLKEHRNDAKVFASSYEVTENLEKSARAEPARTQAGRRLHDFLKSLRRKVTDYDEFLVLSLNGQLIASSADTAGPVRLPSDWPTRAKRDGEIIGEPYWDEHKHATAIMIAVPIRTPDSRLLGVLAARLNFKSVGAFLAKNAISEVGQVYLLAQDGAILVEPSQHAAQDGPPRKLPQDIARSLFAEEGTPLEYMNADGNAVMGVLRRGPILEWGAVAEIRQEVAFAQVIRSRNLTLLMVVASLFLVGLLAYGLGVTLVRPLDRLAVGASKVAVGDLAVDVPIVARGEIATLTETFNDMVARLRQGRDALAETNRALSEKNKELETLSITDHLTVLYNRKHMMERLAQEASRERRHQHEFSILLLDLDHFKKYNDTFGHLAGDRLLAKVAALFKECVRAIDYVARYGGEEFLILLPETNLKDAVQAAERIRTSVAAGTLADPEIPQSVTISIGVAAFPTHGRAPEEIIMRADEALYEAKRQGRNRVVRATAKVKR